MNKIDLGIVRFRTLDFAVPLWNYDSSRKDAYRPELDFVRFGVILRPHYESFLGTDSYTSVFFSWFVSKSFFVPTVG